MRRKTKTLGSAAAVAGASAAFLLAPNANAELPLPEALAQYAADARPGGARSVAAEGSRSPLCGPALGTLGLRCDDTYAYVAGGAAASGANWVLLADASRSTGCDGFDRAVVLRYDPDGDGGESVEVDVLGLDGCAPRSWRWIGAGSGAVTDAGLEGRWAGLGFGTPDVLPHVTFEWVTDGPVTRTPATGTAGPGELVNECEGNCYDLHWTPAPAGHGRPADRLSRIGIGRSGDDAFTGVWTRGAAGATVGTRRGRTWRVQTGRKVAEPTRLEFVYGRTGDEAFVGDWDGDGIDTPGVRRGRQLLLRNSLSGGSADVSYEFGRAGDVVVVGDWDGDGDDTVALRRGSTWFVRDDLQGGDAEVTVEYGAPDDLPVAGDWDGDGDDTPGVVRSSRWLLTDDLAGGPAQRSFTFGEPGATPFRLDSATGPDGFASRP